MIACKWSEEFDLPEIVEVQLLANDGVRFAPLERKSRACILIRSFGVALVDLFWTCKLYYTACCRNQVAIVWCSQLNTRCINGISSACDWQQSPCPVDVPEWTCAVIVDIKSTVGIVVLDAPFSSNLVRNIVVIWYATVMSWLLHRWSLAASRTTEAATNSARSFRNIYEHI